MRRLKVGVSRSDKKLARRIVGYIERDKWKKLKKFFTHKSIHPGKFFKYRIAEFFTDSILSVRSGNTCLHFAAKMGSGESLRILLKLGANPKERNSRGNYPLHLSAKYCLRNFSKANVEDLVQILIPHLKDVLDKPNSKGTTCGELIDGLKLKQDIENQKQLRTRRRAEMLNFEDKSSDDEGKATLFQQRLYDEANEEYFEFEGKFQHFESTEHTDESYDDWADRIFKEYLRKKNLSRPQVKIATETERPQTSRSAPKLKAIQVVETIDQGDLYLVKSAKLFESRDEIELRDLPFNLTSSPEQIIESILSDCKSNDIRSRLRDALRKWHPDKFSQFVEGRTKIEEREKILDVVTHVSQVLLNYGK